MGDRSIYWQPAVLGQLPLDRHAVIEAAAGTGKTFTIAHLAANLLLGDTLLERILTVTFTEKATAELRARIRALLVELWQGGTGGEPEEDSVPIELDEAGKRKFYAAILGFERAPIFTIHGFCQRVLSEFAFYCRTGFELEVIDGRRIFHRAFRATLREEPARDPQSRSLLVRWLDIDGEGAQGPGRAIDKLEQFLYDAHKLRYQPQAGSADGNIERAILDTFLPAVRTRLLADKRRRGLVDYDDMLAWVWRALDGPHGGALATALRERYRYALVDEFQDTDDLQWRILRRIFVEGAGGNVLYIVGDPKQAIYRFRGADVFAYLSARDELAHNRTPIKLARNYRSTADLIAALNHIFDPAVSEPLLTGAIRYDSPAICAHPERIARCGDGPAVPIVMMRLEPGPDRKLVAREVRNAMGRKIAAALHDLLYGPAPKLLIPDSNGGQRAVTARDVMVLTRTRAEGEQIASFLRAAGVPFAFYKQEGLLNGEEAHYVRDVLCAIQAPEDRARRLKAWMSPFFGLALGELAEMDEVAPGHPLIERLYRWRALAEGERFAELVAALLYESGLANRLLFTPEGERELSNYEQIFDLIAAQAIAGRLSLAEVIALLSDYIAGRAMPPGEDRDAKRLPGDREAVQIMTIHAAKGLEAGVVVLYGGINASHQPEKVAVYHQERERRFAVGEEVQQEAKQALKQEEDQEERRLLYVALTRARARLYLPCYPPATVRRKLSGCYAPLNQRLLTISGEISVGGALQPELSRLFAIEPAGIDGEEEGENLDSALASWSPPPRLLSGEQELSPQERFAGLARSRAPMAMRSYTRLRAFAEREGWELSAEDFTGDAQTAAESDDLAGGRAVGIMLHEVLERLDMEALRIAPDFAAWAARPEINLLVGEAMRRHSVRDSRWTSRALELVYRALTSPLGIPGGRVGPLCRTRSVREMEFLYPIPERFHPLLAHADGQRRWRVERGYFKGFVDFVFEADRGIFFADWKSDNLRSYEPAALAEHVAIHYRLQAAIYTVGVLRWLGIRDAADYEARFGGLLYLFLRGLGARGDPSHGVYFHRPQWEEVCRYETDLIDLAAVRHLGQP